MAGVVLLVLLLTGKPLVSSATLAGEVGASGRQANGQDLAQGSAPTGPETPPLSAPTPAAPAEPQMPDESHRLLAEHAARSHGLTAGRVGWIRQGAWDEDNCRFSSYPPCIYNFHASTARHSWDPDTGQYWVWPEPLVFGSGLSHADFLLASAVEAHEAGDEPAAYLWLGRAIHLLGDMATPAHVHLDTHLPPFDMDKYELWLGSDGLSNTQAWVADHPPGPEWDLDFHSLPSWDELDADLRAQLDAAAREYGGRSSGEALWLKGPEGTDAVLFRLMFLMAEEADNWDSNDVAGEQRHGDLDDAVYKARVRDTLFPHLIRYTGALIDYFEHLAGYTSAYLPLVGRGR